MSRLLEFSLVSIWTFITVHIVIAALGAFLLWAGRREWKWLLVGAALGAAIGIGLTWWFGDEEGILGIPPTPVDRWLAVATFAGLGIAVVSLVRRSWMIRTVAAEGTPRHSSQ